MKKWYTLVAPPLFDNKEIFEVVAADDKILLNRIIRANLLDLISVSSQTAMLTSLNFRIHEVKGAQAFMKLIGHEVSPTYIKTFARRGKSLIHVVVDINTKDGEDVRIKSVGVTAGKISNTTATNLRQSLKEEILKNCAGLTYDELMQEILYGKLVSKVFNKLKQIASMRRVEIRKTERKETFK